MTNIETQNLNEFRAEVTRLKIRCFNYQRILLKTPRDQLKYAGYKTYEEGIKQILDQTEKYIKTLKTKYFEKYPD